MAHSRGRVPKAITGGTKVDGVGVSSPGSRADARVKEEPDGEGGLRSKNDSLPAGRTGKNSKAIEPAAKVDCHIGNLPS
jgi:hypothetical protein